MDNVLINMPYMPMWRQTIYDTGVGMCTYARSHNRPILDRYTEETVDERTKQQWNGEKKRVEQKGS